MPRTIQGILDHQDELADKFENFDPDLGHERPIENQQSEFDSDGRFVE